MTVIKIIRQIFTIIIGLSVIVAVATLNVEWYYGVLGAALVIWGIYDIVQEIKDSFSSSEAGQTDAERNEIRAKIEEEK